VPGIIGLEQRHSPFDFLFWNLANHILREMTLKLAIGSHPIVDAIEQKQNQNSDQSTAAKPRSKLFSNPGRTETGGVAGSMIEI